MKKYVLILLSFLVCASTINYSYAKTVTNSELANAIKLYKSGDYTQCYDCLHKIIQKDISNAVAYYYLAMTSAQIGKKEEAIENYQRVMDLSSDVKLTSYATKGKVCIETPESCNDSVVDRNDSFLRGAFGSGFSEEARSQFEKNKLDNMMREMNRNNDIKPSSFKEFKDFSSYNQNPTNDEIVAALKVLQNAGFSNVMTPAYNPMVSDISLLTGDSYSNNNNGMMDFMLRGRNAAVNPQMIQAMLTGQLTSGF